MIQGDSEKLKTLEELWVMAKGELPSPGEEK